MPPKALQDPAGGGLFCRVVRLVLTTQQRISIIRLQDAELHLSAQGIVLASTADDERDAIGTRCQPIVQRGAITYWQVVHHPKIGFTALLQAMMHASAQLFEVQTLTVNVQHFGK